MNAAVPLRRDIQGLRAIAVLSVVVFHSGASWLKGGFVGVDVFFVISGFLITKILLSDISNGTYSLMGFYRRRIRRLLPALVLVLTASLTAGIFLLSADDMRNLGVTTAATVLFGSNLILFFTSDYFGASAEFQPLLHTWSLAVEEQFYILFPFLLTLVWKRGQRLLVPIMVALVVLSLISSVVVGMKSPAAAFYLPFSRAYELLIGALVAAKPDMLSKVGAQGRHVLSLVGLGLIIGSLLLIDEEQVMFPGYVALIPCLGTALVIATGQSTETIGGRLISSEPFQFFGNLSYSLYLWHWPILVFARHYANGSLPVPVSLTLMIVAVLLAWLTYVFVERRFVRGLPNMPVIRVGSATIAVFASVGAVIAVTGGLEQRFSAEARAMAAAKSDFNPERQRCHFDGEVVRSYASSCVLGGTSGTVAVWGDSHGAELAYAMGEQLGSQGEGVRQITTSACPPAMGYKSFARPNCSMQNAVSLAGMTADTEVETVVIVAALESYGPDRRATIRAGLRRSIAALRASGKRVILLGPIPNQLYDPPSALSLRAGRPDALAAWGRPRDDVERELPTYRAVMTEIAAEAGVHLVDPTVVLCGAMVCPGYDPAHGVLYFNQTHLSLAGARKLSREVLAAMRAAP